MLSRVCFKLMAASSSYPQRCFPRSVGRSSVPSPAKKAAQPETKEEAKPSPQPEAKSEPVAPKASKAEKEEAEEDAKRWQKKKKRIENDVDAEKEYIEAKETVEELHMSNTYYPIDKMPEFIVKSAQKVFSRYHITDVKKWGYLLKQNYQRLASCENPGDISDIPLFANTSEAGAKIKIVRDFKDNYNASLPLVEEEKGKNSGEDPSLSNEQQIFNMQYGQAHAVGYLYKRFPHTYFVLLRILAEIKQRCPGFLPLSCLDYGAGLGSGVLAAIEAYPKISKVAACEPSSSMRKLGKFISKDLKQDVLWVDSLTMIPGVGNDRGKFDLVVLSHVLEEIATPASRVAAIEALWNRVNEGGIFVVVEPGSPKGFRYTNSLREMFIKKPREEACIVAPCPHHLTCPKAKIEKTWCHFSQFVPKFPSKLMARAPRESTVDNEKFCYLVLKKGKTPNVVFEAEQKAVTIWERSYFWPRLILPAIKKSRHVALDLCVKEGSIERRVVSKSHGAESGYHRARRVHWGDLWHYPLRTPNKFRKQSKSGRRLW